MVLRPEQREITKAAVIAFAIARGNLEKYFSARGILAADSDAFNLRAAAKLDLDSEFEIVDAFSVFALRIKARSA